MSRAYFASKDWWDVKKMKSMPVTATNPNAFKGGPPSPLRSLPLGDCCRYVRIDGAHTYAIDGIGKDFLASSLLMLVRMGHFGSGPTERCLQNAYANFLAYCNSHSKNTTIEDFSHGSLKLKKGSLLGSKLYVSLLHGRSSSPRTSNKGNICVVLGVSRL